MKKFLFLIFVLLLVSCGGESDSEESSMAMSDFFDRYLNTLCTASSKCTSGLVNANNLSSCPNVLRNSAKPFEGFHKGESVVFKHKYEMLKNAEDMGWITVDAAKAEECFALIAEMEPCNPLDVQLFDIAPCAEALNGTKTLKQECNQDEECKNGWCSGGCPGSCIDYRQPEENCNSSLDKCVPGYECRSAKCSESNTGQKGEPCTGNSDCAALLFCFFANENDTIGNCLKRKPEGSACKVSDECVIGLACLNSKCTRSGGKEGAPCGPYKDENGEDTLLECNRFDKLECGLSNVCVRMSAATNLQCAESCDPDKGLYCDEVTHICKTPRNSGTCSKNEECVSLYCAEVENNGSKVSVCQDPQCLPINVANE